MNKTTFYLVGKIDNQLIAGITNDIMDALSEDPNQKIILYISSSGGDTSPAIAFYDLMRVHNVNLTTIAMGRVASSGIILFCAGIERKTLPHTMFTIHVAKRILCDNEELSYKDLQEHIESLSLFNATVLDIFEHAGCKMERIKKAFREEYDLCLTPEQAKNKIGLVHEILTLSN